MHLIKHLPVVVPIVVIAQLVFAVTSFAQPGAGLLAAGNYHITTQLADYFSCCGDPSLPTVSVDVRDTTTVANPAIGPSTVNHETDVDIFACGGTTFICGGGCFIAGAADFTSSGVSSAMLNSAFDPATSLPCENRPVGLPAFKVSVSWLGSGQVGTTRKTSIYSCAGYNAEVQTLSSNDRATSSATFSLAAGALRTDSAGLGTIDQRWHAQGVPQDACQSFGLGGVGGKGAGGPGGPGGPGGFVSATQSAQFSVPGPFGFPGAFVSLFSFNNVSRPTGTPPSTTSGTELTVGSFGFTSFVDCFVLQSPNTFSFGSGLSAASVHAVIDHSTPTCPNFPNDPFTDFTVDLTWAAIGPLASIQSTAISDCGTSHQELLTNDASNPATASGTVTAFTDPVISAGQASIGSSNHHSQNTGPAFCSPNPGAV